MANSNPYLRRANLSRIMNAVSAETVHDPAARPNLDGEALAPQGFLFMAIPGAGGPVVSAALLGALRATDGDAMTARRLADLGPDGLTLPDEAALMALWRTTTLRNPFARLAALWRWRLAPDAPHPDPALVADHPRLAGGIGFDEFCHYVTTLDGSDMRAAPAWKSQHLFLTTSVGHSVVGFAGHWDRLDADADRIGRTIGLGDVTVQRDTASPDGWTGPDAPADWRGLFTPTLRHMIADRYSVDLQVFQFTF